MGFTNTIPGVILCGIILTLISEGHSEELENKWLDYYDEKIDIGFEYTNKNNTIVLDTDEHTGFRADWTILEGNHTWFWYFNNIEEVPDNKEYGGAHPYDVGFPKHFSKEEFLTNSDAEGIWMMVHADLPPDFEDPIAHIDFSSKDLQMNFDSINITCFLNGNSSLTLTTLTLSKEVIQRFNFSKTTINETDWDNFLIERILLFRYFKLEFWTQSNDSFIMVDKIEVTRLSDIPTTTAKTTTTTATVDTTTDDGTYTDTQKGSTTKDPITTTTNQGNYVALSINISISISICICLQYLT